jgi:hypothetical protein
MPALLGDFEEAGLPLAQVKEAMESIGHGSHPGGARSEAR